MIYISSVNFLTVALMLASFMFGLPAESWETTTGTQLTGALFPPQQPVCEKDDEIKTQQLLSKIDILNAKKSTFSDKVSQVNLNKIFPNPPNPPNLYHQLDITNLTAVTKDQIDLIILSLENQVPAKCQILLDRQSARKASKNKEINDAKEECKKANEALSKSISEVNKACEKVRVSLAQLRESDAAFEEEAACKNSSQNSELKNLCDCKEKAERCRSLNEEEGGADYNSASGALLGTLQSLNGVQPFEMSGKAYQNLCIPITKEKKQELKQDQTSLNNEKKDLEKVITDLQSNKELEHIEKNLAEAKKRAREEDYENYVTQQKVEAEDKAGRANMVKAIKDARLKINEAISQQRIKLLQFQQTVQTLKDAVFQQNCQDELAKIEKDKKASQSLARNGVSASVIVQQGATQKQKANNFNQCMVRMRAQRSVVRQQFQDDMKSLSDSIQQAQMDVKSQEAQLDEYDKKYAEAQLVKSINDQQAKAERLEAYNALLKSRVDWINQRNQNLMSAQQKLSNLTLKVNQLSNELATVDQRPLQDEGNNSGGEVLATATQKVRAVKSAAEDIEKACGKVDEKAATRAKSYLGPPATK